MLERLRPALIVTKREVRDQFRDWRIIFPVVTLTIFFPFLMNFTVQQILDFVREYGATIIGERLVPFLLMIVGFFPISVSLVIALETFVGEKERGSIEPLLNTPLTDWQLYFGKLLSATVPPLLTSYLGMFVYLAGLYYQHVTLPEPELLIQIIALSTVQAVMMVSGAVVVSSQATTVRSANLLASFIIIPVALLIQAESVVMFWGNYQTLWWAVFGILVLSVLLVRVGLAHFQREELLGREIDVLNMRWAWRIFSRAFRGEARSLRQWYLQTLSQTILSMRCSILVMTILVVIGVILGYQQVDRFNIQLSETVLEDLDEKLQALLELWPLFAIKPVLKIWWQNFRVLLLSMVIGIFSFGILGVFPLIISVGVAGFLFGLLSNYGLPVLAYLGFIIPHGVLEVPAAILASAAVLQAGAILATPAPGKTIGEVWLISMADWAKVMIGLVVPMLFIAACIEAWITPRVVLWFLVNII